MISLYNYDQNTLHPEYPVEWGILHQEAETRTPEEDIRGQNEDKAHEDGNPNSALYFLDMGGCTS